MSEASPASSAPATSGASSSNVVGDAPTEAVTGATSQPPERRGDLIGREIAGRYRVSARLGAGGMGTVYRAEHLALAKPVAIKVIQPRFGDDPSIAQRFVQEARAASALGHQHIVQVLDFGEMEGGGSFLVMEFLEGEDLAVTLAREGPLAWERVVKIGEAIAWALSAAHESGIIHRDIKPANCLRVSRSGDPDFIKVLDFGLAKVAPAEASGERSLTHTGMLLGTPGYIAPELYRGRKADHRVDLYAVGAVMYKLLTGELPAGVADDPALIRSGAPPALRALIERTLADDPERRPATARDLALELRALPRVAGDAPTILAAPASTSASTSALSRDRTAIEPSQASLTPRESTPFSSLVTVERDGDRVRFSLGLPAMLGLVALIVGLVWMLRRPEPPPPPTAPSVAVAVDTPEKPPEKVQRPPPPSGHDLRALPGPDAIVDPPALVDVDVAASTGAAIEATATTTTTDAEASPTSPAAATTSAAEATSAADEVAAVKPTGSPAKMRRILRECAPGLYAGEIEVRWRSDDAGKTAPASVKVEVLEGAHSPAVTECLIEAAAHNSYTWAPGRTHKVTVKFGRG